MKSFSPTNDKVTFVLAPLLASCGLRCPVVVGPTGALSDMLATIPGFDVSLSRKRFEELVVSVGLAFLVGKDAPVDGELTLVGRAYGPALELNECVAFLRRGPRDGAPDEQLREDILALATEEYLAATEKKQTRATARALLEEALTSGKAYGKLLEIVSLQGGDTEALDNGLKVSTKTFELEAGAKGFVGNLPGEGITAALLALGSRRGKITDKTTVGTGFCLKKTTGEAVKKGETIAIIHAKDAKTAEIAKQILEKAVEITPATTQKPKLIRRPI